MEGWTFHTVYARKSSQVIVATKIKKAACVKDHLDEIRGLSSLKSVSNKDLYSQQDWHRPSANSMMQRTGFTSTSGRQPITDHRLQCGTLTSAAPSFLHRLGPRHRRSIGCGSSQSLRFRLDFQPENHGTSDEARHGHPAGELQLPRYHQPDDAEEVNPSSIGELVVVEQTKTELREVRVMNRY